MKNVYQILEQLRATNSRNEKIEILKNNKDNFSLQKVIFLALDPFTQFYIRKIPKYSESNITIEEASYDSRVELAVLMTNTLDELNGRKVTGNAAIQLLTAVLSTLPFEYAEILKLIIQKDLRCGVAASTVNKVWDGLIKEFPVMLCSAFDQKLVDKMKFPAYAQLKADGMRCTIIVTDGNPEFFTRQGKLIDVDDELKQEFIKMSYGYDNVFDGEMLCYEDDVIMNRQTGNGILNKAVKGTISKDEQKKIKIQLWDYIPLSVFNGDAKSIIDYNTRFEILNQMVDEKSKRVGIIETNIVHNMDEVNDIFKNYLTGGFEGLILKSFDSIWEDKRSRSNIKFKGVFDADLEVIEVVEGVGKYQGKLGALKCKTKDGKLEVSIGSGFTDAQREEYYSDKMIGKIVAVEYNMKTVDKHGKNSLFLPVFMCVRFDKDIANNFEELS